jgi:hypothetical protein
VTGKVAYFLFAATCLGLWGVHAHEAWKRDDTFTVILGGIFPPYAIYDGYCQLFCQKKPTGNRVQK